jgi:hypothetical protein
MSDYVQSEAKRLVAAGWSVCYSDTEGVVAHRVCRWCWNRDRRRKNRCEACKGTGILEERRLA